MCHHQNRSLILSIHSGELLHQTSCTSAVKRTGRLICQYDLRMQKKRS